MELPHWELAVLSRAIAYKNLSGAAANIGISQPQLSRILAKLEGELKVVLLDRASRRQSGWTPAAFKLAEVYSKSSHDLEHQVQMMIGDTQPKQVTIGILEGLIPVATQFCQHLFKTAGIERIEMDVYDLNKLEELFFSGELDLIFASREPGKRKFRYSVRLGYQSLEKVESGSDTLVASLFEYQTQAFPNAKKDFKKILISNSLALRKSWVDKYGGVAVMPTPVRKDKVGESVYLIAGDSMSPGLWEKVIKFRF